MFLSIGLTPTSHPWRSLLGSLSDLLNRPKPQLQMPLVVITFGWQMLQLRHRFQSLDLTQPLQLSPSFLCVCHSLVVLGEGPVPAPLFQTKDFSHLTFQKHA